MSALTLLAAQALTLAAFDALPPADAGERALAGKEHGVVVEVIGDVGNGMPAPGQIERGLLERPVPIAGGCTRRRWIVSFFGRAGADTAVLQGGYARTEVAAGAGRACPAGGYVGVNPGLTAEDGLAALVRLDAIRRAGSRVRLTCRDDTRSGLCRDGEAATRRAVARLSPWAVTRTGDGMVEAWLGTPGQAVTAVRFATAGNTATVTRTIPAPY